MEESWKLKLRKFLIKFVVALVVGLGIVFLVSGSRGFPSAEDINQRYRIIADSTFATGIAFAGVGMLINMRKAGAYDTMGYGLYFVIGRFFRPMWDNRPRDLIEYKKEKYEKRRTAWPMTCAGIVFIGVSIFFAVRYVPGSLPYTPAPTEVIHEIDDILEPGPWR